MARYLWAWLNMYSVASVRGGASHHLKEKKCSTLKDVLHRTSYFFFLLLLFTLQVTEFAKSNVRQCNDYSTFLACFHMATTLEKSLNLIILGSNAWRVEVEFI